MDSNGNFVITWMSLYDYDAAPGYVSYVYAQRYDSSGNALGPEFQVNTYSASTNRPSIAMDSSGNFIITWTNVELKRFIDDDLPPFTIPYNYARRYDSSGNDLGVILVDVGSYSSSAAMNSSDNFVITWGISSNVVMKLYLPDQDNDGDGFTFSNDCNDFDPTINPDACDIKRDGIDLDCDGFDRTKGKPCVTGDGEDPPTSAEGKGKTCFDGIDNDGDTFVDCADPDCAKRCKL